MKIFNKIKKLIQKNKTSLSDNQFFTNKTDIKKLLDKYHVCNYTINDDLNVDVNGFVDISNENLERIPVKFNNITDNFLCNCNTLKNLVSAPKIIGGYFICDNNPLISFLEIINCDFKTYLYFSIDVENFKPKE